MVGCTMLRFSICGFTLFLFTSICNASVADKDFAKCASVEGDLARLDCYDKLAVKHKLNGPQVISAESKDLGKWDVKTEINPIDDSKTILLALKSDSAESRYGEPVYMVIRCMSNTTDLFISWNDFLGSEASVLTRVGDSKAVTSVWSLSTDKKASFHPNSISFIKDLVKSNKFIAQITPYNESPVTATFDTSGLSNALKPLRETCKW